MVRKKVLDEDVLTAAPPQSGTVRVRETRVYEQPITDELELEPDDESWADDPFETFNDLVVGSTDKPKLHIWYLPKYDEDGRANNRTATRDFAKTIDYVSPDEGLLDEIQKSAPKGGPVMLELRFDGKIRKRGVLRLAKPDSAPVPASPGAPQVVVQPSAPSPSIDPMDMITKSLSVIKGVMTASRDIFPQPSAPPPAADGNGEGFGEKLLLTIAGKAIDNPKTDALKLIEAMNPKPETGVMDVILEFIRVGGADLARSVSNFVNMYTAAMAARIQQQQQPGAQTNAATQMPMQMLPAATAPGQPAAAASGTPEASSGGAGADQGAAQNSQAATAAAPPPVPLTPADRAWRRTVSRIVDDCFENASTQSCQHTICDMVDRYPEFEPLVKMVLANTPEEVIEGCASLYPSPGQEQILMLKQQGGALKWIKDLQESTITALNQMLEEKAAWEEEEKKDGQ